MHRSSQLKQLLLSGQILILPSVSDAYEARLVQAAGFKACHMSGGNTSAAFGYPDAGLITMTEMTQNAEHIATAVDIPVLSDADTGYGNALNARRAVREFIRAGVAGIHIEDQVSPKRCGYMPGKQVIEMEEAVGKYRAAVDVRNELDPDFVIVARTDVLGSVGGTMDEALRRAEAYRKAGADVTYIEGIKSTEELRFVIERVEKPVMLIPDSIPLSERPSDAEMEGMGIACAMYPGMLIDLVTPILWEYLHDVHDRGLPAMKEWQKWWEDFPRKYGQSPNSFQVSGMAQVKKWEEKYLPAKEMDKYLKSTGIAYGKGEM
ncbi:MAG: isocitrate lyase/PEP mutase family protein [Chloroflexi bacterium]|nr:isocitrate lyase/PEP mutase family protein [Chloroflexota bacterium]